MIAIAVVASLVVYAWVMGYIGGTTTKTGQAIQIQSYAVSPDGTTLYVYVQNVGQGTVNFDPSACVYVNNEGKAASIAGSNSLNAGYTATITITGLSLDVTKSVNIKVVTSGGTYMEASGVPPVTAGGANHAPVATDDSYSTTANTPLSVAAPGVLANDNDPDGNTITAVQVSGTSHSSAFTLNSDGSFAYTPTTGYTGSDSFTYKANDGSLDSNTATVTITVSSAANTAPALNAIGNKNVNEGVQLTFTASATDSDLPAQTLTFSLDTGAPTGASINSATGAFTWTPTEAQGPGSYPITVRVTDNGSPALNDFETITVTVAEVNQAPVLAAISDKTVDELTQLTFTATATDTDVPAQTLTFSLQGSVPSGAAITGAGVFTWTPTSSQGFVTPYQITVRVTDNGAGALYDEETIAVTVNDVKAQVTYVSAGAGVGTTSTSSFNVPYPSNLQAGDLILLQVTVRDTTNTPTLQSGSGFTALYSAENAGSGTGTPRQWIYYKFSDGTETGNLGITIGGSVTKMARMYAFRNVAPSSFNVGGGLSRGDSTTISAQAVTTSSDKSLAVSFVFVSNDNAVGSFTGATGGTWTEAVSETTTTQGSGGCIQLQTATMPIAGGTITGGSYTMSNSDRWGVRAFALIPG